MKCTSNQHKRANRATDGSYTTLHWFIIRQHNIKREKKYSPSYPNHQNLTSVKYYVANKNVTFQCYDSIQLVPLPQKNKLCRMQRLLGADMQYVYKNVWLLNI